jgi:glutamate-ammonia-ligase adenylyltransferase
MNGPTFTTQLSEECAAHWEAFESTLADQIISPPPHASAIDALKTSFVFSRYVSQICRQLPKLAIDLLKKGDLLENHDEAYFHKGCQAWSGSNLGALPERADFQIGLRRYRHREMLRIAVRDICGMADLDATLAELSYLADACVASALSYEHGQLSALWGAPENPDQLVVFGLGKLGARELNFSSDIDVMFAYPREGQTQGGTKGKLDHAAFFERLSRNIIQNIGAHTADGFVFRVDTRLRPYGESGPLVMNFERLEAYYEEQGREWERYALIKARTIAGDMEAGDTVLKRLRPFVFRRYLDYGAFDSLRDMKNRIMAEVRQKGLEDNIKLGSGGIREVEFFGQMFQLIRGGVDPDLQVRPIRKVLHLLARKGYVPDTVYNELDECYVFLRLVENRLQQWRDQQTHQLPANEKDRQRLAASMGFDRWSVFESRLQEVRDRIHHHFNNLLAADNTKNGRDQDENLALLAALWQGVMNEEEIHGFLTDLGYTHPAKVVEEVKTLKEDRILTTLSSTGRQRLDRLVPKVLKTVTSADHPEEVLGRLFGLIKSIQKRASYLALLLENPTALTHLVRLTGESQWIATFLNRHPVLLDELLDPRTLYRPPRKSELKNELQQRLSAAEEDDLEYQMEILRIFKQVNVLRVAASDITHVLPLMKVSDHLTDIAEVILDRVVSICWRNLNHRYGTPVCNLDKESCDQGFVVVGYGKLGGLELGYGSDLDLVFLHAAQTGETQGGPRPIDNTQFFGRLGQRVLHMLTTHTSAGIIYEADMRLRPSGDSGMLVSHLEGFRDYQHNDAWTWEHQALIRARAISGDKALQDRFAQIRREVLTLKRDENRLRKEVSEMRARLREQASEIKTTETTAFDIKQGRGGIVDIEFIVQYLVLRHANAQPQIVRWTDNVRLLQALHETGIIDNTTAFRLRRAYLIFRAMVHRLNLRQQPAMLRDDRFWPARQFVIDTWNRILIPQEDHQTAQ